MLFCQNVLFFANLCFFSWKSQCEACITKYFHVFATNYGLYRICRYLLIIGGGHEWESASLELIHAFDVEPSQWNTWSCHADPTHGFPRSRASFGCELLDNYVYIFGGRHYSKQRGEWALNSCWRLNLEDKTWERLNITLPIDVSFHTSCLSSSGYVYLFGGIGDYQKRINHLYRLRVFVPKLSELAWEKTTTCMKNLSKKQIPYLRQAGVPDKFITRLSWNGAMA